MTNHVSRIIAGKKRLIIQEQSIKINRKKTPQQIENTKKKRSISKIGSISYDKSLHRAFARAKQQIFFNPDMNQFITFTYRQSDNTVEQVLYDIKQFIKTEKRLSRSRAEVANISCHTVVNSLCPGLQASQDLTERFKYVFVMEYQKRGSIHVHMIASNHFEYEVNKNGYRSLKNWKHGYTSVLDLNDFDDNFRSYLYLFKYMKKSQRIGNSFVHTSRNLNNFKQIPVDDFDNALYDLIMTESQQAILPYNDLVVYYKKHYYKEKL